MKSAGPIGLKIFTILCILVNILSLMWIRSLISCFQYIQYISIAYSILASERWKNTHRPNKKELQTKQRLEFVKPYQKHNRNWIKVKSSQVKLNEKICSSIKIQVCTLSNPCHSMVKTVATENKIYALTFTTLCSSKSNFHDNKTWFFWGNSLSQIGDQQWINTESMLKHQQNYYCINVELVFFFCFFVIMFAYWNIVISMIKIDQDRHNINYNLLQLDYNCWINIKSTL